MEEQVAKGANEFLPWLDNLETVLRTYRDKLSLSTNTLSQVAVAKVSLRHAIERLTDAEGAGWNAGRAAAQAQTALVQARERYAKAEQALRSAIEEREHAYRDAVRKARPIAERLRAPLEERPSSQKDPSSMGSAPSSISSSVVRLIAPSNLAVTPQANRVNVLHWSENGNQPGTQYIIEAAAGTFYRGALVDPVSKAYRVVDTVTDATVYSHDVSRSPVGLRVKYRIRAKHSGFESGYSNEVMVACK
jgi:hypothetical protein